MVSKMPYFGSCYGIARQTAYISKRANFMRMLQEIEPVEPAEVQQTSWSSICVASA